MFVDLKLYRKNEKDDHVSEMMETVFRTEKIFYTDGKLKILSYITYVSMIIWIVTEIIYFVWLPDFQFILDYSLCFFAPLYVVLIMTVVKMQEKHMNWMEAFMKANFWNLRCCGSVVYEKLSRVAYFSRLLAWTQLFLGIFAGALFFPIKSERLDMMFFLMFLEKTNKTVYQLYRHTFFLTFTWLCTVGSPYPNIHLYYIIQINSQYKLLNEHLVNIEMGYENDIFSNEYQEAIRKRLIFCISQFQKLKCFRKQMWRIFYPCFFMMWAILGNSMFMAYLVIVVNQTGNMVPIIFLWLLLAETVTYLSILGQRYMDMADEFMSTLNRCLWYRWNVPNRKMFLMLLMYAQKNDILSGAGITAMNLSFAIWIGQKTMSAITFFRAVRRKHTI